MREVLNMNKGWKFHLGDIEMPSVKSHFATYMNSKSQNGLGAAAKSFYDDDFAVIDLPHDYVIYEDVDSRVNESIGCLQRKTAWYRKNFKLSNEDKDKRIVILFDGAGQKCEIWINGHFAITNNSMYNSFYIDVTPYVTFENDINTIAVRITNNENEGWWYEGAGIYRSVHLIKTSNVAVDVWGTFVNPTLERKNEWYVPTKTTIFSTELSSNIRLEQEILDKMGNVYAKNTLEEEISFGENEFECEFECKDPILWDLENTYLYKLVTKVYENDVLKDEYETSFGFRTIAFVPSEGFFLNGKHVKLRGACVHQDHGNLGVAVPKSVLEYRITQMKRAGMNGYRCAHNNPDPELLEICDRLGMLVLDENRWFTYNEDTVNQMVSMVKRDRNHPSVILWSVGNEEPLQTTDIGRKIFNYLKGVIKNYDTSRPVSIAVNGYAYSSDVVNDSDVGSVNYLITKYDELQKGYPNKSIISTESGASCNNRGVYFVEDKTKYSNSYATAYDEQRASFGSSYADAIKASESYKFICGTFVWAGFEYRGEAEYPKLFSGSGIFDNCGIEKDNFYLVQSFWTSEPMIHIIPHWTHPGKEGVEIPVYVYTNMDEVELFVNGESLGKKAVEPFSPPLFNVVYEAGSIKAVGYKDGEEECEEEIFTAGQAKRLHARIKNEVTNNGEDAVVIDCHLLDEFDRFIPTAKTRIFFESDESGEVLAVSNGDPMDLENAKLPHKRMFGGEVQCIVRIKEGVNYCKVTVLAPEFNLEEVITITPRYSKPIKRAEICKSPLSIQDFRIFPVTNDENAHTIDYNFGDMNSSQPTELSQCNGDGNKGYTVIIGKTVAPKFPEEKELSLRFSNVKGKMKIRVFHDKNCWPNPTPDEFKDFVTTCDNESANDVIIPLEGFSADEKINFVICADNSSEFSFETAEFTLQ